MRENKCFFVLRETRARSMTSQIHNEKRPPSGKCRVVVGESDMFSRMQQFVDRTVINSYPK